jgi:thiaminase/transcriptional activator TenA
MGNKTSSASFATYAENHGEAPFSEWLRERSEPMWTEATHHRFIEELGADTLDDEIFRRYLIQDHAFLETGASLTGYAVGQAHTMDEKARLTDALSMLTGSENEYFERSFDALDVSEADRTDPPLTATTREFRNVMMRAALEGGYEETLTVTLAAEWVYLSWATYIDEQSQSPSRFYLDEWIEIHATQEFEDYIAWLCEQIDQYGPNLSPHRQGRVDALFRQVVELEASFFDMAYEGAE